MKPVYSNIWKIFLIGLSWEILLATGVIGILALQIELPTQLSRNLFDVAVFPFSLVYPYYINVDPSCNLDCLFGKSLLFMLVAPILTGMFWAAIYFAVKGRK
jgi:hypothetical protein